MNRVKTLLAASLSLAITFTLSCSGGDDNNEGGNTSISDLPKQAYIIVDNKGKKEEYNGSVDIKIREFDNDKEEYYYMPAGKIQNGQVSLNLPNDIESKYLVNMSFLCEKDGIKCNVADPKTLTGFDVNEFSLEIPDKSDCSMELALVGGAYKVEAAYFTYTSQAVKITGTYCTKDVCVDYDSNFSKDWNVYYSYNYNKKMKVTSNLSETGGTLEWHIHCDD
jgi:hypothetical protein